MEGLSPKSKYIIDTMNELREKLDLADKGLDMVQKDAQSTNDKVGALSRSKEEGSEGGNYNDPNRNSRSSREERHERHDRHRRDERCERRDKRQEDRRDEDYNLEIYIDWELKVKQMITFFDIQG
ncbi:hypothetical protein CR513_06437, partial [Mucuna pruriens]